MFNFKKIIALLLCFVMLSSVVLTSCDSDTDIPTGITSNPTEPTEGNKSTEGNESIGQHTHTPASAVKENLVDSTCNAEGSYDDVIYCSVCGDELSRTEQVISRKDIHKASSAVQENMSDKI